MDKLGVFDQLFYKADQYKVTSMIMGGASILEPADAKSSLDAHAIAGHLAARLGDIPLLRTKFIQDPLRLGSVKKVEDPDFDIGNHIFVESLPAPGGYEQLSQRIAELSAEPLDLAQLWRWIVIGGLEDGKLAVMCKIHHAMADGVGLMEVLSSMYDASPVEPEVPAAEYRTVAALPSPTQLLGGAIAESGRRALLSTPRFFIKNTGPLLSALGRNIKELATDAEKRKELLDMPDVTATSLNITELSATRSVSWRTLALPEVKAIARHFSCTINDVGLLLYSYAMQHYFAGTGEQVDFDLYCGVPVNTRNENSAAGGNQVTAGRVCLHNTVHDPIERLKAISADAHEMKAAMRPQEQPLVEVEEVAELVQPIIIDGLLYLIGKFNLFGKMADTTAIFNSVFSNIPGPRTTVYIANAAMSESIPMIPVVEVLGVSGGISSVDQAITIGFHCDGGTVKNPELFIDGIDQAMQQLRGLVKSPKAKARPKKRAKAKPKHRKRAAGEK